MPVIIAPGFAGNVISIEDSDSEVSDDVLEVLARLPDTQQDHPARVAPHPNAKSEVERQANCSRDVREVFPDICLDYLAELYQLVGAQDPAPAQTIIDKILGGESYPKEKEKLNLLKRKRSEDDEEKRANDLASHFSGQDRDIYSRDGTGRAHQLLKDEFPSLPANYISMVLRQNKTLYPAYMALELSERTHNPSTDSPFHKLKSKRKPKDGINRSKASWLSDILSTSKMDGRYGQDELLQELYAARSQRLKDQVARQALDDAAVAEALNMEEYKDTGMMECGCCFDEYPMNRMTHCDEFHFFCLDCAKRNANNEIGQSRYKVKCMDAGGCKSEFTRDQLIRFLDDKAMSSLTRFQQADELQMASLDGLTKCPFCDFAAICPPVEVDKEFRCLNPECEKVSCRLCQLETHVPMSCKEFAKSNKTTVRHAVEEAMTEALVRTCNKCQNKYIKETGCNKMTCTKCGSFQCYVCSKTIENGYSHFNDPAGRGNGTKCPLYDNTEQRHEEEIKKAEKAAIEQVKALHPEIDQGDLKIEVSEAVKLRDAQRQQAAARQYGPYQEANPHHHHHHHHVLQNAVVNAAQAPRRGQIAAQGMGVYVPHGNAQQAHAHAQNVQLAQQLAQRAQIRAQQLALRVQADLANEHALIAQARLQREVVGNAEILPQLFYAPMGGAARGNRDEVNAPLPPWVAQLPGNHYDPQAPMADAHFNWQGPAINPNPFLQYQARPPMQQNHQGGRILGHNLVYQHPHHGAYPPAPNGPNAGAMVARAAQSITAPTVGPRHARNAHRARARAIATARRSQATNAANAAGNQPAANTEGQNYNVAAAPDIVPAVGIHHARAAARRARANALATAREVQLMARDQQSRR